jgi:uncharacterized protein YjdB
MKNSKFIFAVFAVLSLLAGCEKGDPTALKEAVRLASLNISSITVEPTDATITTGSSYQFSATGYRPDGSSTDVTNSVVWSSSNEAIATVNSNGLVTTATDGSIAITASLSSLDGSTSLTASSAALQSIAVFADTDTPNDLSVSECKNLQLKAIGTYVGESSPRDTTPITKNVNWTDVSGNGSFGSSGLLLTKMAGTIVVRASLDGIDSPDTDVTANSDLVSISVAPENTTLAKGSKLQFSATGTYSDASTTDITENALWNSGTQATADFNTANNGEITGLDTGSTIITASCGTDPGTGIEGTTNLTVNENVIESVQFEDTEGRAINPYNTVVGVVTEVRLVAILSDGNPLDVTENSQWTVFNDTGNIVSVNNASGDKGKITALAVGTGIVQATYQQTDHLLVVNVSEP